MKNIYWLFIPALLIAILSTDTLADSDLPTGIPSPAAEVESAVNKLVKIVETYPGEKNTERRRKKMRETIEPLFDFEEMAKRSLGAEWKKRTPEERKEFVRIFADLLANTYLNRIEKISKSTVKVMDEKVRFPRAIVKTKVEYKGDSFPIDYRLINRHGKWQVYDVVIENIGLVSNYRSEFAGIIRKEKFSGLMERLRNKAS
ncbi:MAG: ABC transporter substrate-binding protein [Candidatus Dadabacteria bacterium]|nr:MAG: ABC transporter substrate-binding protein [Candidatus Dadabacteria bacterium]